jgi:hypothetical protein
MEVLEAGREADPEARVLGVLVTPQRPEADALFAATLSSGNGSPPIVACGPGGDVKRVAGPYALQLAPLSAPAASCLADRALRLARCPAAGPSLAELLERLARFAYDLRTEVGLVDLGTIVPVDGVWRCVDARVVIRRRVDGHAGS